jgi:hypothetical protein
MSKVSRDQLKDLVKECLLELLAEGLGKHAAKGNIRAPKVKPPSLSSSQSQVAQVSESRLDKNIKSTVDILTENSVLKDILSDTARTTLQQQLNTPDPMRKGGLAGLMSPEAAPDASIPADVLPGADKWATLAFGVSKNR